MALSFDQVFGIHQHTMRVRNDRAEVIAGNLANADTPGYKARGLDFNVALIEQAKLKAIDNNPPMTKTNEKHMDLSDLPQDPELILKYRLPYQADTGNGEYRATMRFLNGRISKLMSALQSGAN